MHSHNDVVAAIEARLGPGKVRTGADIDLHLEDFWGRARGRALCAVFPETTAEVAAVLAFCHAEGIAVFPQGGNTTTCMGAIPDAGGRSIVLCLSRMNRILAVDPVDGSLTAEAGCILADIQRAAAEVDRFFPLSLGAEGSCQIGGNVSTNAGGTSVLRYGNTRDLVLGMEVVLPDGRIWNGLRTLRKNNTGYDLKHLFIGAEGSLGVITAVSLKLFPSLPGLTAVLVAFDDIAHLASITQPLRRRFDTAIIAMELISGSELRIARRIFPNLPFPLDETNQWFLLVDIASTEPDSLNHALEEALAAPLAAGRLRDVLASTSEKQRAVMWRLRHSVTEAHKKYGMGMSHDIAVPIGRISDFLQVAGKAVEASFPTAEIAVVGHVGDGNIHYNVIFEKSRWDALPDPAQTRRDVFKAIYDIAAGMNGTFSAEHGIGALHVAEMEQYKPAVELDMMRGIKALFDPGNIMNPGRVIPR